MEQARWFAGPPIRNTASLGGNICTASPISDLNPVWMAAGAEFVLLGKGTGVCFWERAQVGWRVCPPTHL